jgi:large subunit ribosomal protein L16
LLNSKDSYLVADDSIYLTKSQLEAGRKVMTRIIRRHKPRPKVTIVPTFLIPITSKSNGSRMGKGKGSISKYVCKFSKNSRMFKFHNIQKPVLIHLFRKVALKLPIKLKYIYND